MAELQQGTSVCLHGQNQHESRRGRDQQLGAVAAIGALTHQRARVLLQPGDQRLKLEPTALQQVDPTILKDAIRQSDLAVGTLRQRQGRVLRQRLKQRDLQRGGRRPGTTTKQQLMQGGYVSVLLPLEADQCDGSVHITPLQRFLNAPRRRSARPGLVDQPQLLQHGNHRARSGHIGVTLRQGKACLKGRTTVLQALADGGFKRFLGGFHQLGSFPEGLQ